MLAEGKICEDFPKTKRLLKNALFKKVMENGKKYYTFNFIIFLKNSETLNSRLGIIVSKKFGKSVRRNRAKRLIREAFRRNYYLITLPLDIVFIVKNNAKDFSFSECEKEFINVINEYFNLN